MIPVRERIRIVRETALLTQEELDLALQAPQGTVAVWEAGGAWPTFEDLIALTDVLGISADIFLKGDKRELRTLGDAALLEEVRESVKRTLWRRETAEVPDEARASTTFLAMILDADSATNRTEAIGLLTRQIVWAKAELDALGRPARASAQQTALELIDADRLLAETRLATLLDERRRLIRQA